MEKIKDWQQTQCYWRRYIIYTVDKKTGKKELDFKKSRLITNWDRVENKMSFPCGKCLHCQKKYSVQWAVRCMLESQLYIDNCFVTLTYDNEHLPPGEELVKKDYQLFLKRLRRSVPQKIRYFLAGEYGGNTARPHYHIILFNYKPNDLKFLKKDKNVTLYTSNSLSNLWGKGFISVGIQMDIQALKYTAKYLNKMKTLPNKTQQEFIQASTSPGIGHDAFRYKFLQDNGIWLNGVKYSLPRYYKKKAAEWGYESELLLLEQVNKKLIDQNELTPERRLRECFNYFLSVRRNRLGFQHLFPFYLHDYQNVIDEINDELRQFGSNLLK